MSIYYYLYVGQDRYLMSYSSIFVYVHTLIMLDTLKFHLAINVF